MYIRACTRTSIVLRAKTARGCTSVSSSSLHACMMNSRRGLPLSEVTEHKVMTEATVLPNSAVLRPRFLRGFSLTRPPRGLIRATMSSSSIAPAAAAYCYIQKIARISYGFFRFRPPPPHPAFHQRCFIRNCALLILLRWTARLNEDYHDIFRYLILSSVMQFYNGTLFQLKGARALNEISTIPTRHI